MDRLFFYSSFFITTLVVGLYVLYAFSRNEKLATPAKGLLWASLFLHFLSLMWRTMEGRQMPNHTWYFPWSNWFESLSFFSFVILTIYLLIQSRHHVPILGLFITPIAWIVLVAAVHSPTGLDIPLLPPVLQSSWMSIHVLLMFIAYAGFANAFGMGAAFLVQERQLKMRKPSDLVFRLPALDDLDQAIQTIISLSLPILLLGLAAGMRWGYLEWGHYWSWDAKEIWTLLTWFFYFFYLLLRWTWGWRGRRSILLSMIGFLLILFTFFGVNYISHWHGYLSVGGQ